ncbi:MAG: DUF4148 domain-containing protein [Alcaligenaceae bacterium]|nr:DUF4148 domain-containing protein [Alcaligenaceae bacterium]
MKSTQISAIAIALSALFTSQAMAADYAPKTRTQVQTELAEAINNGNMLVTESGRLAKQVSPSNYPTANSNSLSREVVRAELAEAVADGSLNAHISN